jgi:hypothetical protein
MINKYAIYWNDTNEVFREDIVCKYEELKFHIRMIKLFNPLYTVEAVEEIIEQKMRIDIDGEV